MAGLIYSLCAITALFCAVLLLRSYKSTAYRLLFWSGLSFLGLTSSNFILVVDKLVFPETDLLALRLIITLLAMMLMLYGLIWENE